MQKIIICLSLLLSTVSYADPFYIDEKHQEEIIEEKIVEQQTTKEEVESPISEQTQIDREEPEQKRDKQEDFFEPVEDAEIQSVSLKYAQAQDIIDTITKGNGSLLNNGYIHFDKQTNTIILKSDKKNLKKLANLIHKLDQPIKQVAIEARIVTISSENLQELGIRWGMFNKGENTHQFAGKLEGNGFQANNLNVNFPVLSNAASAVLQIATINNRLLDLELTALEQENSVEIIASPSLITTNKNKASIKQGTEIAYPQKDDKGNITDIEFRDAVLGLEVTPHFAQNNQILLDLLVTQNAPNTTTVSSQQWVTIDKQEIQTQVLAKNGKTIVLGGIFQKISSKEKDAVPLLGSLPVLKYLFSHTKDKIAKRELVIFMTPHIIRQGKIILN